MILPTSSLTDCPWKCGLFLLYQLKQGPLNSPGNIVSPNKSTCAIDAPSTPLVRRAQEPRDFLIWCTFLKEPSLKHLPSHNFEFSLKVIPKCVVWGTRPASPCWRVQRNVLSLREEPKQRVQIRVGSVLSPALTPNFRCVARMWEQRGHRVEMRSNLCGVPFSPPPPPPFFPVTGSETESENTREELTKDKRSFGSR